MIDWVLQSFAAYAATFVLTSSRIAERTYHVFARRLVAKMLPGAYDEVDYFIQCRMCTGFWVSFAIVLICGDISLLLPVYGLSYFICTQERP